MHLNNGKKLYNEWGITSFHETERYVNDLNIYNRSKNGTNVWDDLTFNRKIILRTSVSRAIKFIVYFISSCPLFDRTNKRLENI